MKVPSWLVAVAVVLCTGGISYGIHRSIVAGNVETGRPLAEQRKSARDSVARGNSQRDTLEHTLKAFQALAQRRPTDSLTIVNTANLAFDLQKWDLAEKYYTMFLDGINAGNLNVRVDRAFAMFSQGKQEAALTEIDAVLGKDPKFQMGLLYKAVIFLQSSRDAEALPLLKACKQIDPASVYGQRADALLQRLSTQA